MSRPKPHEWSEALAAWWFSIADPDVREQMHYDREAVMQTASEYIDTLAPLIEREREAAREEGMAAVAGPILALIGGWRARAAEVRAAIPTDAAEALARIRAEAWDEGWKDARQVVWLDGVKCWAHTVFPEGGEGNPYRTTPPAQDPNKETDR